MGFGLHVLLILKNLADFATFQNRQIRSNAGVETRIEHADPVSLSLLLEELQKTELRAKLLFRVGQFQSQKRRLELAA